MLRKSRHQNVAIVGINREAAGLLNLLLSNPQVRVLRIINPAIEDIGALRALTGLSTVINMTDDPAMAERLGRLRLPGVDIMGGLSARILFMAGQGASGGRRWTQDRQRILESLYEIRQAVLLSKNKEELLKLFLHIAITSCRADSGSIMLADSRKKFLRIEMADGLNVDIMRSAVQKFGSGIAGKVARTGKPMLTNGPVDRDEGEKGDERRDLVSSICCPLVIREEVVGVLNINSRTAERIFDDDDLHYIKELSDFAADVVKTSKESEITSSSAFSLSLLNSAQEILNMKFPLEERLNLLLMKIVNSYSGVICNYYRFIEEPPTFLVHASSSFNMNLLRGKRIVLNQKIAQRVLETEAALCLESPDRDSSGKKWYIAQPVWVDKRIAGLLFFHLVSDKKDTKEESTILEEIGGMISQELSKSMEMRQLKLQSAKLTAVSEATFNIASAATLRELADFALPNLCLIMEAEACIFWLLNPVRDVLEVYSSFCIDKQERLRTIEGIDAAVIDTTVPGDDVLLVRDLCKEGFAQGDTCPKSLLSKSFGRDGGIAAVLSLYGKKSLDLYDSRSFTAADKEVFLKFCLQFSKGMARLVPYFDEKK